ncbi:MAG: hypothetical protein Tsb0021_15230 [Chlamydiales bacterium]
MDISLNFFKFIRDNSSSSFDRITKDFDKPPMIKRILALSLPIFALYDFSRQLKIVGKKCVCLEVKTALFETKQLFKTALSIILLVITIPLNFLAPELIFSDEKFKELLKEEVDAWVNQSESRRDIGEALKVVVQYGTPYLIISGNVDFFPSCVKYFTFVEKITFHNIDRIPKGISLFPALQKIDLTDNEDLKELSDEFEQLDPSVKIDYEGTQLSDDTKDKLEKRNVTIILKWQLEQIQKLASKEFDLQHVLDLPLDRKRDIRDSLGKILNSLRYHRLNTYKAPICDLLGEIYSLFKINEPFKDQALFYIRMYIGNCEDQSLKLINILNGFYEIEKLRKQTPSFKESLKILAGVYRGLQLDEVIKKRLKNHEHENEELEIALHMQIHLAQELGLLVFCPQLLFDNYISLYFQDIIEQEQEIVDEVKESYVDGLFDNEVFENLLKDENNQSYRNRLDQLLNSSEELNQLNEELGALMEQYSEKKNYGEFSNEFLSYQIALNTKGAEVAALQRKIRTEWVDSILND